VRTAELWALAPWLRRVSRTVAAQTMSGNQLLFWVVAERRGGVITAGSL
jgi:hypothetical protein